MGNDSLAAGPLAGVRVVEVAMFAPDGAGMHLADLGAEVIKVEQPGLGDPARLLGVAFRGESPATRRWNRGKRSIALDLRTTEGATTFRDLVGCSEVVVEGMRPGALERRSLGYADLLEVNPDLVFASVSGWGLDGPYRDLGSHGLAFDSFAGLASPREVAGQPARPSGHVWHGLEAGPLYAAFAVVAGVLRARAGGGPSFIEVSQADAAASWNMWRIAYEAAVDRHGTAPTDPEGAELVAALEAAAEGAGQTGPKDLPGIDVRYQYYATTSGHILLMATETRFWRNFCSAVDRPDLFERWPGRQPADHDYANAELRAVLTDIFLAESTEHWVQLFIDHDIAGAPVWSDGQTHHDPHFASRDMWLDPAVHGVTILGSPVRIDDRMAVAHRAAPAAGQDGEQIMREILGYDDGRIAELASAGALGNTS